MNIPFPLKIKNNANPFIVLNALPDCDHPIKEKKSKQLFKYPKKRKKNSDI